MSRSPFGTKSTQNDSISPDSHPLLRKLVNDQLTFKAMCVVLLVANFAVIFGAFTVGGASFEWKKAYIPMMLAMSGLAMFPEFILLSRLTNGIVEVPWPNRRLLTIGVVGFVAALALSIWVGTQLYEPPNRKSPGEDTREMLRRYEQDPDFQRGAKAIENMRRTDAAGPGPATRRSRPGGN